MGACWFNSCGLGSSDWQLAWPRHAWSSWVRTRELVVNLHNPANALCPEFKQSQEFGCGISRTQRRKDESQSERERKMGKQANEPIQQATTRVCKTEQVREMKITSLKLPAVCPPSHPNHSGSLQDSSYFQRWQTLSPRATGATSLGRASSLAPVCLLPLQVFYRTFTS